MQKSIILPFYAKVSIICWGLIALAFILFIGHSIIIPIVFSVIVATLLNPIVVFISSFKIHKLIAISITLFLVLIVIVAFGLLMFSQINRFGESWPIIIEKLTEITNQSIIWISGRFDISAQSIIAWIAKTKEEFINSGSSGMGRTILSFGSGIMSLFIIPVYIFMILYYQPILLEFFQKLFGAGSRMAVLEIIYEIKSLIRRYLLGLLLETAIIATLYTTGLLLMGIEYAVIFGIVGALLNLIPYIGSIIAAILPMIMAVVTKPSPWFALLVLALFVFVQFIDNNFIVPKIVASKVKINALISITAVLAFAALWGIPGMLLAIPITGIIKLVFDHIEPLKPWGFLFGDIMPIQSQNSKLN